MRNPTPLLLALFLALTAGILSLRKSPAPEQKPPTVNTPQLAQPAPTSPPAATVTPAPWPTVGSDIPADPKATFGHLENGLRYIILPNPEPPTRLSIRLHIRAGSLMEAENQRGLAHFLEHMVFNGTKNFKDANKLIREMQTRGIAFGSHVNAYTSFDETVYMLDLPDQKPDTLDLCFKIMRDFGDGALLSTEEINAERGVILAEKSSRDSVGYRMMEKQFSTLLPTSLIAKRFPIGSEDVIKNSPRERFIDFYSKYYIPSRMTLVVVGDMNPQAIETTIKNTFASMKNPLSPGTDPDMGTVTIPEGIESHIFADAELDSSEVSLNLIRPFQKKPDTTQTRAEKLTLELANLIISRRFERLAKQENSPIAQGGSSNSVLFNNLELGSFSITAAADRWQEAIPIMEQEFRRILVHGFLPSELSEAKANLLNSYQEAVKSQATRESAAIATAIAGSVNDATIYSTPETDLTLATTALQSITPTSAAQAFKSFWEAPGHHLILSTKTIPQGTTTTLAALYQESTSIEVSPPAERQAPPFGYTNFGSPGKISTTAQLPDLGITQITLSNRIRITLKKTDFEKNQINILARIGSGQLSQPKDKPMLDSFATAIFNGGGLGQHSNDDLAEILAGRNVSSTLSISEDAFVLSGLTTPADQLLQLQLMTAMIADPGYRPEALWQFQKAIPVLFQNLKHTPSGPIKELGAYLRGGDSRFLTPSQIELSKYSITQVKKWLTPELEDGFMELSIVGDFDPETLTKNLLTTLGTLPRRDSEPADRTLNPRTINFPTPPSEKTLTYDSKIPQGIATAIWKTAGIRGNTKEFRRLNILSDIFGDRLREEIREKLGASYSPNAGASGSDALADFGYLIGQSSGKPADIPLILTTMQSIATQLAQNGATQDELDRALTPVLSDLEKTLRDNSYWLTTVLSQSQSQPERIDLARGRSADYRSITLPEINSLAAKYFPPANLLKITIVSKPTD